MLDDISRARRADSGSDFALAARAAFFFRATMSSSRWACSRAASATVMRWRAFWCRHRTFCCSTSPPTTWTCAPRMCLLEAIAELHAAPWSSSRTTAISSIAWPRACSKSRTARSPRTRATTKIICAERRRRRWRTQAAEEKRALAEKTAPAVENICAGGDGTIVIEGGYEGGDGGSASASERSRRLNPIKQKQMEDRCAFLEERFRASKRPSRTPRSNLASTSLPPKPSGSPRWPRNCARSSPRSPPSGKI